MIFELQRSMISLNLRHYLQRYWPMACLGGFSILAVVAAILAIGYTLHPLIQAQDFRTFQSYLGQLSGWVAILALASFGRSYGLACLSAAIMKDIKRDVMSALLRQELSFYDQEGNLTIIQRFQENTRQFQQFLSTTLGVMLRNMLMLMGGLVLLFTTSAFLTLIALLAIPLILLPISLLLRTHRRRMKWAQSLEAQESTYVAELLQNMSTLQAFTAEEKVFGRFLRLLQRAHVANHGRVWIRSMLAALVIFLVAFSICGILCVGVYWVNVGQLSPGALASFIFYVVVVAAAFSALTDLFTDGQRAREAFQYLQGLKRVSTRPMAAHRLLPHPLQGILAVHHLSFAYPHHSEQLILKDVTFSAARGEVIAIVGPSGAGKSTLFSLLLGFYEPQGGQIFLDGVDQVKIDPREWRQHFGFVPQEPFIFADTLYNNFTIGHSTTNEQQVWQVLEEVALADFVRSLPQDLQTLVGQGGVQLSVGQKQRVAIARVLLRDPKILLLDEATTALDAASEHHVQESLTHLMRTRTTLVVAHRLKTVLQATRIVVINQGQVEAIGTHSELISQPGLYQHLAMLEFKDDVMPGHLSAALSS